MLAPSVSMATLCTSRKAPSSVTTSFPPSKDVNLFHSTKLTASIALTSIKKTTKLDSANSIPKTVPLIVNTVQQMILTVSSANAVLEFLS